MKLHACSVRARRSAPRDRRAAVGTMQQQVEPRRGCVRQWHRVRGQEAWYFHTSSASVSMLACTSRGSLGCPTAVRLAQGTRRGLATLPVAPPLPMPAHEQLAALPSGRAARLRRCFARAAVSPELVRTMRLVRLPAVAHVRLASMRAASDPGPTGVLRFVPTGIRSFTLRYGLNFVGIYLGVYWLTLLGIYSTITVGAVGPRDIMHHIESAVNKVGGVAGVPLASWLHLSDVNPDAAPLMAAWMLTKPTEPPRLIVSAAITPRFTRWVRALRAKPVDGQRALRCADP